MSTASFTSCERIRQQPGESHHIFGEKARRKGISHDIALTPDASTEETTSLTG